MLTTITSPAPMPSKTTSPSTTPSTASALKRSVSTSKLLPTSGTPCAWILRTTFSSSLLTGKRLLAGKTILSKMPEKSGSGLRPTAPPCLMILLIAPTVGSTKRTWTRRTKTPARKVKNQRNVTTMTAKNESAPIFETYENEQQNRFGWPHNPSGHQFDCITCVQEKFGRVL